jgi:hypothetical protein
MPDGAKISELSSFCLTKRVPDLISIKAGPDNIVSGPVMMRGNDDISAKPGDILADSVVILSKVHL